MAASSARRTAWWQRRLTWGALIALGLGGVSAVTDLGGAGLRLGAVLTISGIVLTLAIDFYVRLEEIAEEQSTRAAALEQAQATFTQALDSLVPFTGISPGCRAFLTAVAEDWRRVEETGSVFLTWIMDDQQHEFRARLHNIAKGQATVDRHGRHYFRSTNLKDFARIRSLSATNPGYWSTQHGLHYLSNQRVAIAQGLQVSRYLVLGRDELESAIDVVRAQLDAGVDLSIIVRDDVSLEEDRHNLRDDRSLVTDNAGVVGVLRPADRTEIFTTDEAEVRETDRILRELRVYAQRPHEIFPGRL
jgi:hypothetical protein